MVIVTSALMPGAQRRGRVGEGHDDRVGHDAELLSAPATGEIEATVPSMVGVDRVDRDRGRLTDLDVGQVALDDVGRDLEPGAVDDDGGARRGVEPGGDVDRRDDAGDRCRDRGGLDLGLEVGDLELRVGELVLGAVEADLGLADLRGDIGVLGVGEGRLRGAQVDLRGVEVVLGRGRGRA